MKKDDPLKGITVEPVFDDKMKELEYKYNLESARLKRFSRRIFIILGIVMLIIFSIWAYDGYKAASTYFTGKAFCEGRGFGYSDSTCIENIVEGEVIIHEINLFKGKWSFVKDAA